ncbi:MAG: hypothetical protein B6D39_02210 [Anaerolineae bacterium UTCFX2]|jgi:dihydrofolate synthase/folylpolyglutamate synthase|nr:bifunctional folylpolyglutamate synthase/dihydrofolate synthase [Anaerolineae bacterium]MCZ7551057.1 bifunctional folylpolyglutamate synthase/dihydrofolate synthase [Anaerolineales bacterium]OQY94078.1 MAG: hypothetical protein B6D39_02210 [Anaerolineae bacterium UTCFX2]
MDPETSYQKTLEYLYSFVDYSLSRGLRNMAEKFNLDRMRRFLEFLGNPERAYPIIHVAGTKGKGSVCALCASALEAAGYRVGLYTSPHLQDYAERIQINRAPIPHTDLVDLVNEIRPFLDQGTEMTTFEITTALALLYFAKQKATAVVLEVGLGGRLDATNVVQPNVTVITSISYDHTQVLGETLAEIAAEKGGIIKSEVPVVIAPQKEEAGLTLEKIAARLNAPVIQVGKDYHFVSVENSLEGQSIRVWNSRQSSAEAVALQIPLLGEHQLENTATAYAALRTANDHSLPLSIGSIQEGFRTVNWPGRFEILQRDPPLVIDAAHNRDSARRLMQALEAYFKGWAIVLVFGASEDKDIAGMLAELLQGVDEVIFTRSYHPRAIEPDALIALVQEHGKPARTVPAVEDALDAALQTAGRDKLVLVTGSIFIAAGARHSWYNRGAQDSL